LVGRRAHANDRSNEGTNDGDQAKRHTNKISGKPKERNPKSEEENPCAKEDSAGLAQNYRQESAEKREDCKAA
jgi:hypothetical protein